MTTVKQRLGRRWYGDHQGEVLLSFCGSGSCKIYLLKVAVVEEISANRSRLWASFSGRNLPIAAWEWRLVSKVKYPEMLEYWILYYSRSGQSPVTLDTFTRSIRVPLRSLVFWSLASDFSSLLVLDDSAIKMCSLDMNTECLAKSGVFGVWPLPWPPSCVTSLEFNKLVVRFCGKYYIRVHSSHFGFHRHWAEEPNKSSGPLLRILWSLSAPSL
jgi:hypothetical protein